LPYFLPSLFLCISFLHSFLSGILSFFFPSSPFYFISFCFLSFRLSFLPYFIFSSSFLTFLFLFKPHAEHWAHIWDHGWYCGQTGKKGTHLNSLEKYCIYWISEENLHINNTYIRIFETIYELHTRQQHTFPSLSKKQNQPHGTFIISTHGQHSNTTNPIGSCIWMVKQNYITQTIYSKKI
jgi:hypothetical protein